MVDYFWRCCGVEFTCHSTEPSAFAVRVRASAVFWQSTECSFVSLLAVDGLVTRSICAPGSDHRSCSDCHLSLGCVYSFCQKITRSGRILYIPHAGDLWGH